MGDPFGLLEQAVIDLPRLDGTGRLKIRADRHDKVVELLVDGDKKWRWGVKTGLNSLPFDYKWLRRQGAGVVTLKTCSKEFKRTYTPKTVQWRRTDGDLAYGMVENLGLHSSVNKAFGAYIQFETTGPAKFFWSSKGAVWKDDIAIRSAWQYNPEAGQGTGRLFDDRSPFGTGAELSESRTVFRPPAPVIQNDDLGRRPPDIGSFATTAVLFHRVGSKWFVHGDPAELTVRVMLSVSTPVGSGHAIPTTASFELPGAPRAMQDE